MTSFEIHDARSQAKRINALLEDKLYEFNVEATGFADGKSICFVVYGDDGEVVAGLTGYTWGGCADIKTLWVDRPRRNEGLGRRLMEAAEAEAIRKGCAQIVLFTHSFQAPRFYEKLGFQPVGRVSNYPKGRDIIFYVKPLPSAT